MRLNQVDLNLFVVFDTIYTERNLTRAAEVLCVTQSAVSNALSRLRRTFNDELFVRTPRAMVPTPVAENIVGRVREALQLLDSSVVAGDRFDPLSSERRFRLSTNDVMESILLPALMDDLGRSAPGMTIECYYTRRRELGTALSSGQLELAIDIAAAADATICHVPLFRERYVCLVRSDHPAVGERISLEQYLALGHIHVSSRPRGLGMEDIELPRLGRQRRIQLRLEHCLVVPDIVRRPDLALTVSSRVATGMAAVKALELPFDLPPMEYHLLWHRSADEDRANRWLRERIIALCQGV
ncbi:MAG: LysR family transcriptional regulator [Parahaliea sp.]